VRRYSIETLAALYATSANCPVVAVLGIGQPDIILTRRGCEVGGLPISASSWCRLPGARSASVKVYGEYVATILEIHRKFSSFSVAYIRRCSSVRGNGVMLITVASRLEFKIRILLVEPRV
jgi:hypothetical protein